MKFESLLAVVRDEPIFETGFLLTGAVDPADVRRQLSRWTQAGRLVQLRRGLYMLTPPFQKSVPHPFLIANRLTPASYVSCQSALAFYGLIPEYTPVTISVTTRRPEQRAVMVGQTHLGEFIFHHLQQSLFFGYQRIEIVRGQSVFIALPEKAILDMAYLHPGGDDAAYLAELRLQHLDQLDVDVLAKFAARFAKPKLTRVADGISALARVESSEYTPL